MKKIFIIASLFIGISANAHPGDPVLAISNDEKNASITILDGPGADGDAKRLFSAMLTSVENGDTKRFKSDAISITCERAEPAEDDSQATFGKCIFKISKGPGIRISKRLEVVSIELFNEAAHDLRQLFVEDLDCVSEEAFHFESTNHKLVIDSISSGEFKLRMN